MCKEQCMSIFIQFFKVRAGHGKPGKSWELYISRFTGPGLKSHAVLKKGNGKSTKLKLMSEKKVNRKSTIYFYVQIAGLPVDHTYTDRGIYLFRNCLFFFLLNFVTTLENAEHNSTFCYRQEKRW